jgi:hypothetical protein
MSRKTSVSRSVSGSGGFKLGKSGFACSNPRKILSVMTGLMRVPPSLSVRMTVTEVCNQFEQHELTKDNVSRIYSTKKVFLITRFVEIAKATVARLQESENVTVVQPGGSP